MSGEGNKFVDLTNVVLSKSNCIHLSQIDGETKRIILVSMLENIFSFVARSMKALINLK